MTGDEEGELLLFVILKLRVMLKAGSSVSVTVS